MSWDKTDINLGVVGENSTTEAVFTYTGDITVKDVKTSCGCTTTGFDEETGQLTVTYKASRVPKHLEYVGRFVTRKQIRVETTEGVHLLQIRATIVK